MRTATQTGDAIKITIGGFGSEPQELIIEKDSTIKSAIDEAGISVDSSAKVYVNGVRASFRDLLDEGDIVNVVTPKQAGNN